MIDIRIGNDGSLKHSDTGNVRAIAVDRAEAVTQKMTDHCLAVMHSYTVSNDRFFGDRLAPIEWKTGDVAYIPAEGEVTAAFNPHAESTVFRLEKRYFHEVARDHVNYDRIDLRFGQLGGTVAKQISGAVLNLAHNDKYRHWPLLVETTKLSLTMALISELSPEANALMQRMGGALDYARKKRVVDYVESNLHKPMTLDELAGVASMSPFHFSRMFKGATGFSPIKYLAHRRVDAAKRMMRNTTKSLAMIAFATGFVSHQHFSTTFRTVTGTTPGQYRNTMADLGDRRFRGVPPIEPKPAAI